MRLIPAAGCAWGAGALTALWPACALPLGVALWSIVIVLVVIALLLRRRTSAGLWGALVVAVAAAALVVGVVLATAPLRSPPALESGSGARHGVATVEITSFVERRSHAGSEAPGPAEGDAGGQPAVAVRFSATLESMERGGSVVRAAMPVTVLAEVDDPRAHPLGQRLRFDSSLVPRSSGDTRNALLVADGPLEVVAAPPWWLGWAQTVRSAFRDVADGLPADGGDLLTGLVVGDDSELPEDLRQAMLDTGLTHLTAVSGANCAIVVGAGVALAAVAGAGLRSRLVVGGLLLATFVVLVTPQPSVLRAAVMAAVVLISSALGRSRQGLSALALAVVLLLAADPALAVSAGFALSVAATGGLLVVSAPAASLLARVMPRPLATVIAVPVSAQVACQPLLFLLDPSIALYAVPANLLAEPAAAFTTITGSIVCVLAPLAPPLAAVAGWLPWLGSAWIAAVARTFASLPGAVIRPEGSPAVVAPLVALCCAAALVGAVLLTRRPRLGVVLLSGSLVMVLAAVAIGVGRTVARSVSIPGGWVVAACDIGQGDALVVRSAGRFALIDAGPDPALLEACLDRVGVSRLDLAVLTHYDHDHVGGASALAGRVDEVLVGPDPSGRGARLRGVLGSAGAQILPAWRGMHGTLGSLRWDVLWPREGSRTEGNDASVTLLVTGALRMLFLGDLSESAQDRLRAAGPLPVVDVVKVSHHGSADQSEALYREVRATVGLISVGAGNDYGHPTQRLLGILDGIGTTAFRTDLDGLILLAGSSGRITMWSERAPPAAEASRSPPPGPGRTSRAG